MYVPPLSWLFACPFPTSVYAFALAILIPPFPSPFHSTLAVLLFQFITLTWAFADQAQDTEWAMPKFDSLLELLGGSGGQYYPWCSNPVVQQDRTVPPLSKHHLRGGAGESVLISQW